MVCRSIRWRVSHTIINGRRLTFTGTPADLLGRWVVWWLLSVITFGIYTLWISVKIHQWEISHTCFEERNPSSGQTYEDCFYDGTVGERVGQLLVSYLFIVLTCGIYTPWAYVRIKKFDFSHSVIGGERLEFKGTGAGYWGENFVNGILVGVTCGIYTPWAIVNLYKWVYRNTYVVSSGNRPYMY